jgi:tRNA A37 threonylcarbamoyladenosine dehydratase
VADPRFSGISRLYGEAALGRFQRARVAVIGIGGVGSWAVEALARSGVGGLAMVDLDEICLGNVNRQLHAMDGQIGRLKTAAMAERVRAIHPGCQVTGIEAFFREENAASILDRGFDAVVDAIDVVRHKALLLAACRQRGIPVVTCGGAGGRRDPTRIRVADLAETSHDPLLLAVRRALRSRHGFPTAPDGRRSAPFAIPAVFSDEPRLFPACDGSVSGTREQHADLRLNCESGYGTSSPVTASFGLAAASVVLGILAGD